MEIPGGRGEQPEPPWNGKSGGVGAQTVNNPPWGGYGYFLELHNGGSKLHSPAQTLTIGFAILIMDKGRLPSKM